MLYCQVERCIARVEGPMPGRKVYRADRIARQPEGMEPMPAVEAGAVEQRAGRREVSRSTAGAEFRSRPYQNWLMVESRASASQASACR